MAILSKNLTLTSKAFNINRPIVAGLSVTDEATSTLKAKQIASNLLKTLRKSNSVLYFQSNNNKKIACLNKIHAAFERCSISEVEFNIHDKANIFTTQELKDLIEICCYLERDFAANQGGEHFRAFIMLINCEFKALLDIKNGLSIEAVRGRFSAAVENISDKNSGNFLIHMKAHLKEKNAVEKIFIIIVFTIAGLITAPITAMYFSEDALENKRNSDMALSGLNKLSNRDKLLIINRLEQWAKENSINSETHKNIAGCIVGSSTTLVIPPEIRITELPDWLLRSLSNVAVLDISGSNLVLPPNLASFLPKLDTLILSNMRLTTVPEYVYNFRSLKELDLSNNHLTTIPPQQFSKLLYLNNLDLLDNPITNLPEGSFNQTVKRSLQVAIRKNLELKLNKWVEENAASTQVREARREASARILACYNNRHDTLNLAYLKIENLPEEVFDSLSYLTNLYLNTCNLTSLPKDILKKLTNLSTLELGDNNLADLTNDFFKYTPNLIKLDLSANHIQLLPNDIFLNLSALENLNLSCNLLTVWPEIILNKLFKLKKLNLNSNSFNSLPIAAFSSFKELNALYLSSIGISNWPAELFSANLTNTLSILDLSGNGIVGLSEQLFSKLTNLYKIDLARNLLTTLPENIFINQIRLQLIDLRDNRLNELPEILLQHLVANIAKLQRGAAYIGLKNNSFFIEQAGNLNLIYGRQNIIFDFGSIDALPSLDVESTPKLKELAQKIVKDAGLNIELSDNWNSYAFLSFINKIEKETQDAKTTETQIAQTKMLAEIIIKMDRSQQFKNTCFAIAHGSTESCGDRVALGFVQMQLQLNLYKDKPTLQNLYESQRVILIIEILSKIIKAKITALQKTKDNIDEVEVYLAYILHLKEFLNLQLGGMLYERVSGVTDSDIAEAKKQLKEKLTEKAIFTALIDSDVICKRFRIEFDRIANKEDYDTTNLINTSSGGLENADKLKEITANIQIEKIDFIKGKLDQEKSYFELLEIIKKSSDNLEFYQKFEQIIDGNDLTIIKKNFEYLFSLLADIMKDLSQEIKNLKLVNLELKDLADDEQILESIVNPQATQSIRNNYSFKFYNQGNVIAAGRITPELITDITKALKAKRIELEEKLKIKTLKELEIKKNNTQLDSLKKLQFLKNEGRI